MLGKLSVGAVNLEASLELPNSQAKVCSKLESVVPEGETSSPRLVPTISLREKVGSERLEEECGCIAFPLFNVPW